MPPTLERGKMVYDFCLRDPIVSEVVQDMKKVNCPEDENTNLMGVGNLFSWRRSIFLLYRSRRTYTGVDDENRRERIRLSGSFTMTVDLVDLFSGDISVDAFDFNKSQWFAGVVKNG